MTDPMKNTGRSGVSDNAFSGPTGAQSGSSNTQVNHYAAPSPSPGGAGQWARVAMVTIAVLFVAGAVGLAAIKIGSGGGGRTQAGQTSEPTTSPTLRKSTSPASPQSTSSTTASPLTSPPVAAPGFSPGPRSLTPVDEALCVDVEKNRNANDMPVQMWDCNHAEGQRWRWEGTTLRAFSRCLDVLHERTENKTPVILYDCTGGKGQKWEWTRHSKLRNPLSMRCLGYPAGVSGRDVQLAIYNCDSEAARVWTHQR
jgi:hypothetical protein